VASAICMHGRETVSPSSLLKVTGLLSVPSEAMACDEAVSETFRKQTQTIHSPFLAAADCLFSEDPFVECVGTLDERFVF
jgi:hypothetical protein